MQKILRIGVTLGLIVITSAAVFAAGFAVGHVTAAGAPSLADALAPGAEAASQAGTPPGLRSTFGPFWEAWDLVHAEFVDQPLDDVRLMQGAISGMMDSLGDEHSSYMSPAEYQIAISSQQGELEGIGASVEPGEDYVRITGLLPGSPAQKAGLLPGDLIIAVGGEDMKGVDYFVVISKVRGPAGSTAHMQIRREGQTDPLTFDVVRAKINLPSVESEMRPDGVAYVKVNEFGDKTTAELKAALKELLAHNPAGLVLDLRGNPGGYLNTAIEVVSQFIPEGVVMREKFGDGREQIYEALGGGLATQVALVVLIDHGSASASEIVAGAVQDRGRGTLVGETSYGKGSVQNWHPLRGDNGAVRVTIARWLTPEGRSISGQGITPELAVQLTADDHAAGRDPQLDRAVELLLAQ